MLKMWLDSKGLEYEEIDIEKDLSKRSEFMKLGYLTVPILVHDGEVISHEPYSNITTYLDNKLGIKVIKRDGSTADFDKNKIKLAISKANEETSEMSEIGIEKIVELIVSKTKSLLSDQISVEDIQDIVEEELMLSNNLKTAKAYILYRQKQADERKRDIFKPRISLKPYEYPELEKYKEAIQHSYWLFSEYNYTSDIQDYKANVKPHERTAIKNSMLAISQVEVDVKAFWGDLYKHLPKPEFANVGASFAESEVRHSDAYANLLELLGLNDEFEKIHEIPALMNRVKYLKKHNAYTATGEQKDYMIAVLLFSAFIENVSLFSQFLVIMSFNKHKNLFNGMSNVIEATSKEENLHYLFGIDLVNTIKEEHPEWFDEEMINSFRTIAQEAYDSEMELLDWIFEDGELDFLSKHTVNHFLMNRFNNAFVAIGLDPIFEVDEQEVIKTDWLQEEVVTTKHVDFFHKRSINYTKRSKPVTADDLF